MLGSFRIVLGDCRERLRELPEASVQCVVTSPPYYGLRAYGTEPQIWGGSPGCEHRWSTEQYRLERHGDDGERGSTLEGSRDNQAEQRLGEIETATCADCGAWRGELGLEPSPLLFVEHVVEVFREVRRVLRDDGTLWLNLGDCFANDTKWGGYSGGKHASGLHGRTAIGRAKRTTGLKPKDLLGMPWRVAFALQADGWWLRSDIIWAKSACMPESVTDRPTRAHEYVFLLTKRERYYYDADAIREPHAMQPQRRPSGRQRNGAPGQPDQTWSTSQRTDKTADGHPLGRNKRSVWTVNPEPFPAAHFAVMPARLALPCILAGSRRGDLVLDPFCGAGTTGLVAVENGRDFIGIELNVEYAALAETRIRTGGAVGRETESNPRQQSLFEQSGG